MRRFLAILIILLVAFGALAAYLYLTTPGAGTSVRFPLGDRHRALLTRVPASADSFALIPTAPQLHAKLKANPVTRDLVATWTAEQQIPHPWLLGGADLMIWKRGKSTSYAVRVDVVRAFLLRAWLLASSNVPARFDGSVFIINSGSGRTLSASELDPILRLADKLPEGDMFVVQRESARGAFPPLSRPSASSVRITPKEISIASRARTRTPPIAPAAPTQFPKGAVLSATFVETPRLLGDLRRILQTDIGTLVAGGGSIALYDVDAGTLLPRPKGVIAVPANDARRAAMQDVTRVAALFGETRDTGQELLVSFDRSSLGIYLKDTKEPGTWPANRWAMRLDPRKLVPILERLGDNPGLRLAAPRIYRSVRDLRRWMGNLQTATEIEAAESAEGGVEELRVRIASE
jgi:hypothetical protein